MKLNRRKFLKSASMAAGLTAMGGFGVYSSFAGTDGLKEDYNYFCRDMEKPKHFLADSHAHPIRPQNANELEMLVDCLLIKNVLFQSVSAIVKSAKTYYYEQLREDLSSLNRNYEIEFSDDFATIVKSKEKKVIFIRSQEVTCLSPDGKEVHVGIEGMKYFADSVYQAETVIKSTLMANGTAILNHPYTVPQYPMRYWIASGKHEDYLRSLMRFDGLFVEAFNAQNVLHMAASNGKAESLAKEFGKIMVASTDCHRARLDLVLGQLGIAGFYVERVPDFNSLTGKEIIQLKKNLAINSPGLYRNYCPLGIFWDVMLRPRWM